MNDLMEFLTSEEVMIVFFIAVGICLLGTIYFVIEKNIHNRRKKKNTKELNDLVDQNDFHIENEELQQPVIEQIIETPVVVEQVSSEKTDIVEEIEPVITKVKEEKPLVIPIEEFNEADNKYTMNETTSSIPESINTVEVNSIDDLSTPSVENIYTKVKDEIESLDIIEDVDSTDVLQYTEAKPNKEEAKAELRKATEELIKTQIDQQNDNIDLTKFEEEQESNAIISLDELMSKSDTLYEQNEATQYADEGNEPISLTDLEARMNNIKKEVIELEQEDVKIEVVQEVEPIVSNTKKVVLDDFNTIDNSKAYQEDHIFKSSPIISPIFGIEKNQINENNLQLENTANYEKLDQEIKKTNEFLGKLRELQKNLD